MIVRERQKLRRRAQGVLNLATDRQDLLEPTSVTTTFITRINYA